MRRHSNQERGFKRQAKAELRQLLSLFGVRQETVERAVHYQAPPPSAKEPSDLLEKLRDKSPAVDNQANEVRARHQLLGNPKGSREPRHPADRMDSFMGLVRLGQKEGDFTDFENGLMRKQLFALKGPGLRSSNYCHAELRRIYQPNLPVPWTVSFIW